MALNEETLQALKAELLDELGKEQPSKEQLSGRLAEIRSADIGEVLEELIEGAAFGGAGGAGRAVHRTRSQCAGLPAWREPA